jgi:hypothetical protein
MMGNKEKNYSLTDIFFSHIPALAGLHSLQGAINQIV